MKIIEDQYRRILNTNIMVEQQQQFLKNPKKPLAAFMFLPWSHEMFSSVGDPSVPRTSNTKPSSGALRLTIRQKRRNLRSKSQGGLNL